MDHIAKTTITGSIECDAPLHANKVDEEPQLRVSSGEDLRDLFFKSAIAARTSAGFKNTFSADDLLTRSRWASFQKTWIVAKDLTKQFDRLCRKAVRATSLNGHTGIEVRIFDLGAVDTFIWITQFTKSGRLFLKRTVQGYCSAHLRSFPVRRVLSALEVTAYTHLKDWVTYFIACPSTDYHILKLFEDCSAARKIISKRLAFQASAHFLGYPFSALDCSISSCIFSFADLQAHRARPHGAHSRRHACGMSPLPCAPRQSAAGLDASTFMQDFSASEDSDSECSCCTCGE